MPSTERLLLGPGPSPIAPRVMRAMAAPVLSHLDPDFLVLLDDVRARRVPCRSFYLDLTLLEDYWVRRTYHHTLSSTMIYALCEALIAIDEEGIESRWARHRQNHQALARGLHAMGLELLPREGERLWTLNAVKVPPGVDEALVRNELLERYNIEIGSGLGPLAGKIWRVGLMGAGSTAAIVTRFLGAFEQVLRGRGFHTEPGAGVAAAAVHTNS